MAAAAALLVPCSAPAAASAAPGDVPDLTAEAALGGAAAQSPAQTLAGAGAIAEAAGAAVAPDAVGSAAVSGLAAAAPSAGVSPTAPPAAVPANPQPQVAAVAAPAPPAASSTAGAGSAGPTYAAPRSGVAAAPPSAAPAPPPSAAGEVPEPSVDTADRPARSSEAATRAGDAARPSTGDARARAPADDDAGPSGATAAGGDPGPAGGALAASSGDLGAWAAAPLAALTIPSPAAGGGAPVSALAAGGALLAEPLGGAGAVLGAQLAQPWAPAALMPAALSLTSAGDPAALLAGPGGPTALLASLTQGLGGAGWPLSEPLDLGCALEATCSMSGGLAAALGRAPGVLRGFVVAPLARAGWPPVGPELAPTSAAPAPRTRAQAHPTLTTNALAPSSGGAANGRRAGAPPSLWATTRAAFGRLALTSTDAAAATPAAPPRADGEGGAPAPQKSPPGGTTGSPAGSASAPVAPGGSGLALIVALALAAPFLISTLELAVARRRPLLLAPRLEAAAARTAARAAWLAPRSVHVSRAACRPPGTRIDDAPGGVDETQMPRSGGDRGCARAWANRLGTGQLGCEPEPGELRERGGL